MKKKIQLLLVVYLIVLRVYAYDMKVDGVYYNYIQNGKALSVTYDKRGSSENYVGKVVIPAQVKDEKGVILPVCEIGEWAFNNCVLTDIEMAEGIRKIAAGAFNRADLSKVVVAIPASVDTIDDGAFFYSKPKGIIFSEGLKYIGHEAFCGDLLSEPAVYDNVVIPNSVKTIGYKSFEHCNIKNLVWGTGVEEVYDAVFTNSEIENLYIQDLDAWLKIPFTHSEILVWETKTKINNAFLSRVKNVYIEGKIITDMVIPDNVDVIPGASFCGLNSIQTLTLRNKSLSLGRHAFAGCKNLRRVNFPEEGVGMLGAYAFSGCSRLSEVAFPSSIPAIPDGLFSGCGLKDLVLPDDVGKIGSNAFENNANMASVSLPAGLTKIGDCAFANNTSLKGIVLPPCLEEIGNQAFECTALSCVDIPAGVNTIGTGAFSRTALDSVHVPSTVKSLGSAAFMGCGSLRSAVLDCQVTGLEKTFADCRSLQSVRLPESVAMLDGTFKGCESLGSISVPDKVSYIGNETFMGCQSLTEFSALGDLSSVGGSVFSGCSSLETVCMGCVEELGGNAFSGLPQLRSFTANYVKKVGVSAFQGCGSLSVFQVDSCKQICSYAFMGCSQLKVDTIPAHTEEIDPGAFSGCDIQETVVLPASVKQLSLHAFRGIPATAVVYCHAETPPELYGIDVWGSARPILFVPRGSREAYLAGKLGTKCSAVVEMGEGFAHDGIYYTYVNDSLGLNVAVGRPYVGSVCIPDSVTEPVGGRHLPVVGIDEGVFRGKTGLTEVSVPKTMGRIGPYAFAG